MTVIGLHHVLLAIPAGSEPRQRRFYGGVLGLREVRKPEVLAARGGVWFALAGDQQLHLGVDPDFRPARKAHPCLVVTDIADVADAVRRSGATIEWDDAIPGVRRFHTFDPVGNRLEVQQASDGRQEVDRHSLPVTLRPADPAEAGAITAVEKAATQATLTHIYDPALHPFPERDVMMDWADAISEDGVDVIVAVQGGHIVGFVAVDTPDSLDAAQHASLQLRRLVVAPDMMGAGISDRLHEAALDRLRGTGCRSLLAWVLEQDHRGRRFFARHDWEPIPGRRAAQYAPFPPEGLLELRLD